MLSPQELDPLLGQLFLAIEKNNLAEAREAVRKGVDLNQWGYFILDFDQHNYAGPPLIMAFYFERPEIIKFLLASGADPTSSDCHDKTALHFAAEKGYIEIVSQLLANPATNINQDYEFGNTALHCAAEYGQVEVAQLLISRGAQVNQQDGTHGDTPLHLAARAGVRTVCNLPHRFSESNQYPQLITLLINAGADPNIKNNQGNIPKQLASSAEILRLL